ncbi:MAG: glycoside hydrolase family 43 protein [Alistipes sp.]|nr:glycoside hydrolase family 43 protein [Alistipes sp.]
MKSILFLVMMFAAAVPSALAQQPAEGVAAREGQLLLADPFILENDGWYYIYGTHADDGIVVYRSRDMRHWSDRCGNARNALALHKDDVWGDRFFWAPEVYKLGEGRYLMTYSAEEHICYAESDSPCGPFVQREQRPYLDEKGIDSSIFFDDDGTPYMFWVRFTAGNVIWVAEMTHDLHEVRLETARRLIDARDGTWERVQARVAEGPMVVKHKGKYYLTYSCNDYQSKDYAVGVAVADNVMGPYVRCEGNPILHRHAGYVGTGHHALLRVRGGRYYIVYHAHNSGAKIHPRQTLIAPLEFRRDRSAGGDVWRMEVSEKIIVPMVDKQL